MAGNKREQTNAARVVLAAKWSFRFKATFASSTGVQDDAKILYFNEHLVEHVATYQTRCRAAATTTDSCKSGLMTKFAK